MNTVVECRAAGFQVLGGIHCQRGFLPKKGLVLLLVGILHLRRDETVQARMNRGVALLPMLAMLMACGSVQPRAAVSSYACMQAVRARLPEELPDKRLHCLASAGIARQCSVSEAYLAALGKELRDVFGAGDAAWTDWRADRIGVRCGRGSDDEMAIHACCERHGY